MSRVNSEKKSFWTSIIKGSIYSLSFTLILILIFALLIRFVNIPDSFISPVNQIIKVLCIFLGCFISLKKTNKGFIKGMFIGLIFTILVFLIFSFIGGTFNFSLSVLLDILFGILIGGISGIIVVNIRK